MSTTDWPDWPDDMRAVPNVFLRNAVFSTAKERVNYSVWTVIGSCKNVSISIFGQQLNQTDFDYFLQLLHLVRNQNSNTIYLDRRSFLKELSFKEKEPGGWKYDELLNSLERMQLTHLKITINKQMVYTRNLIYENDYDDVNKTFRITLNNDLKNLFEHNDGYTYVQLRDRLELGDHKLAKFLQGFCASHTICHGYKVKTFKDLADSKGTLSTFRKSLKVALQILKDREKIIDFAIATDSDLVTIVKKPTKSQRKHIEKKARANESQSGGTTPSFDDHENQSYAISEFESAEVAE